MRHILFVLTFLSLLIFPSLGCDPVDPRTDDDDSADDDDDTGDDDDDSAGPCVDDGFEDNDDIQSATVISMGLHENLAACDKDLDFYQVTVTEESILYLDVYFTDDLGDIDVAILDSKGATLGAGSSTSDNESLQVDVLPGDYFLEIGLYPGASQEGNTYSFEVNAGAPPECASDSFEPNNTQATAVPAQIGNSSSLNVCEYDEDFYSITVPSGGELTADLTFSDAEGDIDVRLLNSAAESLAYGSSTSDNESVSFTATENTDVTIRVYLYSDDGSVNGNTYEMDISLAVP